MVLLVAYLISLVVGQSIAVGIGLLVENLHSPRAGLLAFIPLYFVMFWLAWRIALRLTAPRP
jgi:hypothetical protein